MIKNNNKKNKNEFGVSLFFNLFTNKKANAVAVVLLAMVGLVAAGLYAKHNYSEISTEQGSQNRITTEVDIAVQSAVTSGLQDFLTNGFSKQNEVWYCNYPYPVDFTEAKESIHYYVDKRVDSYLDELRLQGYSITEPEISFPGLGNSLENVDKNKLIVKVGNLKVGTQTENLIQEQDLSREYTFDWPVWLMFYNYDAWMHEDGGGIVTNIYNEVFYDKPCQIIKSMCNCTEDRMIAQGLRDGLKLNLEDMYPALDKSVDALNTKFAGTGIVCNYSIEKYHIENIEKFTYSEAQTSYLNYTPNILEWNTDRYHYNYSIWTDEFTLPGPGRDALNELGGCPTWDSNVSATLRPHVDIASSLFNSEYESADSDVCTYAVLAYRMHTEEFALDKKVGMLVKISCEDPGVSIEGEEGMEPLSSEIISRISVRMDCPTPTEEHVDEYVADANGRPVHMDDDDGSGISYACPGGSCFPAGTPVTMADGSKKAIENVAIGDSVLSFDPETSQFKLGVVKELESPLREGVYKISFDDQTEIEVTNEHPFYTKKSDGRVGWASIMPEETYKETKTIPDVLDLEVGDYVFSEDQKWKKIISIDYNKGPVQTYNLKDVSNFNNFFAGENLVHNKCCFPAGTLIDMADGTKLPIEQVKPGDYVLSYDSENNQIVDSLVSEIESPVREGLYTIEFVDGRVLRVTNDHPLFIKKIADGEHQLYNGWGAIDPVAAEEYTHGVETLEKIEVGDYLLDDNLDYIKIIFISYKEGDVQTYNLKHVNKNNNFFADGFLAHNKIYGFIGPICVEEIVCPTCQGCAYDGSGNPTCVPAPMTECPGVCTVCGETGQCDMPAPRGVPCTSEGDCMVCDGINTGVAGCTLFDPPEARAFNLDCSAQCMKCAGDGSGCTAFLDEEGEQDDCPDCQTCGTNGQCVATEGVSCGECSTCSANGLCEDIYVGKDCGGPCERCLPDGSCGIDLTFSGINNDCGTCEKCGLTGCVTDISQDGESCSSCKTCSNGKCNDPKPDGTACGSKNGCQKGCKDGSCNMGLNIGASCDGNYECASSKCNTKGECALSTNMNGKQCCGDKICNAGDPCCPFGGWSCGACDDTTT